MEREGKEGSQWALPAADENNKSKAICQPPPPGCCFDFHFGRFGLVIHLRTRILFFVWAKFFLLHLRHTYSRVLWSLHSLLPSVADTMSRRPISTFFGTPVQPCPCAKHNNIINAILFFRFQDRWIGKKNQEAYNVAHKACSTLFLNTPMATLCEFIRQAMKSVLPFSVHEVECGANMKSQIGNRRNF